MGWAGDSFEEDRQWGTDLMLTTEIIFGLTGCGLFALGLRGALLHPSVLGRILAINVCGAGVFLMFVSIAYRGQAQAADPVPHALVLTGIVVAVSATALALALGRRLRESDDE
jgi:multicomponent Na+:H+ antiporter subunit C